MTAVTYEENRMFKKELSETFKQRLLADSTAENMPNYILTNILLLVEMCQIVGMNQEQAEAVLAEFLDDSLDHVYKE